MYRREPPEFDNPIDLESVPDRPLTFEFVSFSSPQSGRQKVFAGLVTLTVVFACVVVFTAWLGAHWTTKPAAGSLVPTILAILLIGYTVCRPALRDKSDWIAGIVLSFLLAFSTALIDVDGTPVTWLTSGVLLFFSTSEFRFHWWCVKNRIDSPSAIDPDEDPIGDTSYVTELIPSALLGGMISHAPLWSANVLITVLSAAILVGYSLRPLRETFPRLQRLLPYALIHVFCYPDSEAFVPGLLRSPLGPQLYRMIPSALYLGMSAAILVVPHITKLLEMHTTSQQYAEIFGQFALWIVIGPGALLGLWSAAAVKLASEPRPGIDAHAWEAFTESLRASPNPFERNAIYMGTVEFDNSPILVDRSLLREHVHFLGDSGGGKTSMGLNPMIEQLISFGDSSVVIIDLKGDSLEMLASVEAARARLKRQKGIDLPLKVFTLDNGAATHPFNPLASDTWSRMTPRQRVDVLCAGCGLRYGDDYGRAHFTAINSEITAAAERLSRGHRTFTRLYADITKVLTGTARVELPAEVRRHAVHPHEVIGRLAAITQMNIVPDGDLADDAIDLADCYRTPQIVYFRLPSSIAAGSASAVARLASYLLLVSGKQVKHRRQVYLLIDEFQRMAAENMESVFQLARSLDVSLILANQSLQDLGAHKSSLLNVVETTCHIRQWFTVSGREDLAMVQAMSGLKTREEVSTSVSRSNAGSSESITRRQVQVPRFSMDDLLYVSDHPQLSVLRITGSRRGYAQYRGLPLVVRSQFHITEREYRERRAFAWPELRPGMVLAGEADIDDSDTQKRGSIPKNWNSPESGASNRTPDIEISEWTPDGM